MAKENEVQMRLNRAEKKIYYLEKLVKEKFPENADELYSPKTHNGLTYSSFGPELESVRIEPITYDDVDVDEEKLNLIETPLTISDILDADPTISDYDTMYLMQEIELYVLSMMNLKFRNLIEEFKKRDWKLIQDSKNKCPFDLVMKAIDKAIEKKKNSLH